jgi:phospho-N-acetylmuramoyl-pentapeptide-transferase
MIGSFILALAIAFFLTVVAGIILIPVLRRLKAGQSIKENGPVWHMHKQGTPTMGGLIFIPAIVITTLALGIKELAAGELAHVAMLVLALIFGAIGFLDDFEKLKHKQNLGLTARQKFLLQLAVAIAFIYLLRSFGLLHMSAKPFYIDVYIPFFNRTFAIPELLYVVFAAFVIVGTVNAVNITDGVDGLATGTSLPVFIFYTALCFFWGRRYLGLCVFAAAITGGLLGFLTYNFNPAKVFMGDTGSLFLGGAVVAMAFAYDMPLILILIGVMFIIETLSDIIQVGYFKLTHGKRVFRMAPFHHHLEMGGWTGRKWSEKELFVLFTGITLLFCIISFTGVFQRYAM